MGVERIRGEPLKLNIKAVKRTIQKNRQAAHSKRSSGQSWLRFPKTHGPDLWACAFVPVVTLFLRTLHAFVCVHRARRRVVHVGVTAHPTGEWLTQPARDMSLCGEMLKYIICDNAEKYSLRFEPVTKASGIEVIHAPYAAPRVNALCEGCGGVCGGNVRITCW